MIEPHGLPAGRLEWRRYRQLRGRRRRPAALRQAATVADLNVPPIGILHVETLELLVVVRDRCQPALPELRFDVLRVPSIDGKGERFDDDTRAGTARSARCRLVECARSRLVG